MHGGRNPIYGTPPEEQGVDFGAPKDEKQGVDLDLPPGATVPDRRRRRFFANSSAIFIAAAASITAILLFFPGGEFEEVGKWLNGVCALLGLILCIVQVFFL